MMPNSALLTDAGSSLRFACGAAKRERYAQSMFRIALPLFTILASGCDYKPEKAFESNLVILSQQPVVLTQERTTLISSEAMKVIGESTYVCLSLKGGIPLQDSKMMDQAFQIAMEGAKVKVEVVLKGGKRIALHQPLLAWSMQGKIIKNDELSACASTPCKAQLPVGAQVSKVEISSQPSLHVQGIYWQSEKSPVEKRPATATTASAPRLQFACAS